MHFYNRFRLAYSHSGGRLFTGHYLTLRCLPGINILIIKTFLILSRYKIYYKRRLWLFWNNQKLSLLIPSRYTVHYERFIWFSRHFDESFLLESNDMKYSNSVRTWLFYCMDIYRVRRKGRRLNRGLTPRVHLFSLGHGKRKLSKRPGWSYNYTCITCKTQGKNIISHALLKGSLTIELHW